MLGVKLDRQLVWVVALADKGVLVPTLSNLNCQRQYLNALIR